MAFTSTTPAEFKRHQQAAISIRSKQLQLNLAPEVPEGSACYLSVSGFSGFAVSPDGELVNVFSAFKGNGDRIAGAAIAAGARRLNCYDGYLRGFYERHGFVETHREYFDAQYAPAGWAFGRPDVVFMALPAFAQKSAA